MRIVSPSTSLSSSPSALFDELSELRRALGRTLVWLSASARYSRLAGTSSSRISGRSCTEGACSKAAGSTLARRSRERVRAGTRRVELDAEGVDLCEKRQLSLMEKAWATHCFAWNAGALVRSAMKACTLDTVSAQSATSTLAPSTRTCGQTVSNSSGSRQAMGTHLDVGQHEAVALTSRDGRAVKVEDLGKPFALR